jgi:PST family polysaccharide transporter
MTLKKQSKKTFDTQVLSAAVLQRKSINNSILAFIIKIASTCISLVAMSILARKLTPDDFGLIAMLAVSLGFLRILVRSGTETRIIQKSSITHLEVSSLFWQSFRNGLICSSLFYLAGPLFVVIFNRPELLHLAHWTAPIFVISSLSLAPLALISRRLQFSTRIGIEFIALIISLSIGILAALRMHGSFSLIYIQLSYESLLVILSWSFSRWSPDLNCVKTLSKANQKFTRHLSSSDILIYLSRNIDNFLIGMLHGASALGIYTKAYALLSLPISQISAPFSLIVVPILSQLQHARIKYAQYFYAALFPMVAIGFPIVVFSILSAALVIEIVLGPDWKNASEIFRAFAPAAFVGVLNPVTGWILVSTGQSKRQLKLVAMSASVYVCVYLISAQFGILVMAYAFSCTAVLLRIPQIIYAIHFSPITKLELYLCVRVPLVSSILSGLLIALFEKLSTADTPHDTLRQLAGLSLKFSLVYLGILSILAYYYVDTQLLLRYLSALQQYTRKFRKFMT